MPAPRWSICVSSITTIFDNLAKTVTIAHYTGHAPNLVLTCN